MPITVIRSVDEMRRHSRSERAAGRKVGLVPTMGFLHDGHVSLMSRAREEADALVLSIFVNPLQFGPAEDFEKYPRDLDRDVAIAEEAGVDCVFAPAAAEMYPDGEPWVYVVPEVGADRLCGLSRPGHFRGVLTVVAKLFGACDPTLAVFGLKDFQQFVLIRRMVGDLNMGIEIVGSPTVREADGLAMSSRNSYLSHDERERALSISTALRESQALFHSGERRAEVHRKRVLDTLAGNVEVEYAELVDPSTLEAVDVVDGDTVCAIAARSGATRLIDNASLGAQL